jgi:hypothetical protein
VKTRLHRVQYHPSRSKDRGRRRSYRAPRLRHAKKERARKKERGRKKEEEGKKESKWKKERGR